MRSDKLMKALAAIGNRGDGRPAVLTVNDRAGTMGVAHIFFSRANGESVVLDADTIDEVIAKGMAA